MPGPSLSTWSSLLGRLAWTSILGRRESVCTWEPFSIFLKQVLQKALYKMFRQVYISPPISRPAASLVCNLFRFLFRLLFDLFGLQESQYFYLKFLSVQHIHRQSYEDMVIYQKKSSVQQHRTVKTSVGGVVARMHCFTDLN